MSTTSTTTDHTPHVWIGCLHCQNSGHLIGAWFDAAGADEVTLADVHAGSGRDYAACEELWCLDHENLPVRREMSLQEAADWGRVYEEVGAEQWPAVYAWVCSGAHVTEGTGDLPSISDFEDAYQGHWDSFREYVEQLADDTGMMQGWPEEAQRYFSWDSWTADVKFDHVVCDAPAPDYGVYVFRSL